VKKPGVFKKFSNNNTSLINHGFHRGHDREAKGCREKKEKRKKMEMEGGEKLWKKIASASWGWLTGESPMAISGGIACGREGERGGGNVEKGTHLELQT